MILDNIRNYFKGWFIGDFEQSLHRTKDFEICFKQYKEGDRESEHIHKVAKEITVIVSGKVRMKDRVYFEGDIIQMNPGESTDFEALTESSNIVIKIPSVIGDKYVVHKS